MKHFLKQPTLYLAMFIIGSSAGCTDIRNPETRQAQPDATNTGQNPSNQVSAQPNNLNFVSSVTQKVGPAVVRIDATRTVDVRGSGNPLIERFLVVNYHKQESNAVLVLDLLLARMVAS